MSKPSDGKRNFSILSTGMIGSGKSQLAHRFLKLSPRAIVFDPQSEYTIPAFRSFDEGAQFLVDYRDKDFQFAIQPPDSLNSLEGFERYYMSWIDLIYHAQIEDPDRPPIALILDEASYYIGTSHNVPSEVQRLFTKGRHAKISIITIVQRFTQAAPILRDQSHAWIILRSKSLPSELKDRLAKEEIETIPSLRPLTPRIRPKFGVHYVTDLGESVDVFDLWRRAVA